jgi:hypothetical protein
MMMSCDLLQRSIRGGYLAATPGLGVSLCAVTEPVAASSCESAAMVRRTGSTGCPKVDLPRVYSSSKTLLYFIQNTSAIQYKVIKKGYRNCSNCCPACSMHI